MTTLFDPISISEQHFLLASHAPKGKAWEAVFDPDDDFGKLFLGLAVEFYRFQVLEKKLYDEMDINKADELLIDWEKSVGLPNECFSTDVNQETRRKQVYAIFSKFGGVQKKEDFIRVAEFFGFSISISTGTIGTVPLSFPILFFSTTKIAKHTIFVTLDDPEISSDFPLPFPIPFSSGGKTFLQCIFDRLAPANVQVLIVNNGDI